jgi:phosphoglycolate phosphatase
MSSEASLKPAEDRAIIFDLDGTLIDPFVGISMAYRLMARDLGIDEIADETIRTLIGPPIQEALRSQLMLPEAKIEDGVRSFRHHYGLNGVHQFSPIPGVDSALRRLIDSGHSLCIATSKPRENALVIIEDAGWSSWFSIVSGPGLDGTGRHKEEVIRGVIDRLAANVKPVAMVGDRSDDIKASALLGIPAIGVRWGFGSVDELVEAGADYIVDSPDDLPGVISRIG